MRIYVCIFKINLYGNLSHDKIMIKIGTQWKSIIHKIKAKKAGQKREIYVKAGLS